MFRFLSGFSCEAVLTRAHQFVDLGDIFGTSGLRMRRPAVECESNVS